MASPKIISTDLFVTPMFGKYYKIRNNILWFIRSKSVISMVFLYMIIIPNFQAKNRLEDNFSNQKSKPNIVLIQADDLGFDDLSIHGNQIIETPNLDKLYEQSVRFDNFYVNSFCAPTRASLVTGKYFWKTGVSGVHGGRDYLSLKENIISEKLKELGYVTGIWGKWHLGKTDGYFPWDRGFDEAYFADLYEYFDNKGFFNGQEFQTKGWITEVLTDMSIDFITKNRNKPFFAYVPYLTCHGPWHAPQKYIDKYLSKGLSKKFATLCGMIEHLDFHINRLLKHIYDLRLSKNTIVIFMSDNGPINFAPLIPERTRVELSEEEWKLRNPNGLKGLKGTNWENGIKSPLLIRWNGTNGPRTVKKLVHVTDVFPTIMELVTNESYSNEEIDGKSFLNSLLNERKKEETKTIFISGPSPTLKQNSFGLDPTPITNDVVQNLVYENQQIAVRNQQYKLLLNEEKIGYDLFDIQNDPKETLDISDACPIVKENLENELKDMFKDVLLSESAFSSPELLIGYNNKKLSSFYAYTPKRVVGNVKNYNHFIGGWSKEGDAAVYEIIVKSPGEYLIEIIPKGELKSCTSFCWEYKDKIIEITDNMISDKIFFECGKSELILKLKDDLSVDDKFKGFKQINFNLISKKIETILKQKF